MGETCSSIRKSINILDIKFEGRYHLGQRHRRDVKIKLDVNEICCDNLQWFQLSQNGFR
jgi:hypothetical protein